MPRCSLCHFHFSCLTCVSVAVSSLLCNSWSHIRTYAYLHAHTYIRILTCAYLHARTYIHILSPIFSCNVFYPVPLTRSFPSLSISIAFPLSAVLIMSSNHYLYAFPTFSPPPPLSPSHPLPSLTLTHTRTFTHLSHLSHTSHTSFSQLSLSLSDLFLTPISHTSLTHLSLSHLFLLPLSLTLSHSTLVHVYNLSLHSYGWHERRPSHHHLG